LRRVSAFNTGYDQAMKAINELGYLIGQRDALMANLE
jgi:hypothetical protein